MDILQKFSSEIKIFSRTSWWIYIIYAGSLVAIMKTRSGNMAIVVPTTLVHFTADIFIMMMFSAYARKAFNEGAYFQITSMLLFFSIKIYTGITGGGWHYVAADPIYALAALKNYRLDVEKINIKWITGGTMAILGLFILFGILVPLKLFVHVELFTSSAQWLQTAGIFLFAVALSTTGNERLRYLLSLLALAAMVSGSSWETYISMNHQSRNQITGLELSYSLLPLTVLVFYLKRWSLFVEKKPILHLSA